MTVSTSTAKAGPYAGSGTTGPFTVPFRFLENSHLRVIKTSTTGVETDLVLTTDYTVSGAGGASGTVTLTSPLLTGEKLTILRNVSLTQDADYVAGDAFPAETHERALDKLTMITQQLAEEVSRAVKVNPSSSDDPDLLVASVKTSELNAATSAAAAAAAFDAFDDRYLGSKASDPTVDNDGNALLTGALYWNTTVNEMRVWDGSSWLAAAGLPVGMPETAQELAGGVDLNTIQTPGFYVQSQDADAASGTNYPVATAGALVLLKNASGVSQLYYSYGSASVMPRAFFRALYSGSWSAWRENYHSGNLGAASETASGIVELATAEETVAGVDAVRAVHPAGLAAALAGVGDGAAVEGMFKKLSVSSTGLSANVSVQADEIVVQSSANKYKTLRNVNLTIAGTTVGANGLDAGTIAASTWYSIWVIWNVATTAGLMSLSATNPTLPGGYTHKARVGWIRTDGTANKYPLAFIQKGRQVQYAPAAGSNLTALPQMASGLVGTIGTTLVAVGVGNFVPQTASRIAGNAYLTNGGSIQVSPSSLAAYSVGISLVFSVPASVTNCLPFDLMLESTNIYWATNAVPGVIYARGWDDNI